MPVGLFYTAVLAVALLLLGSLLGFGLWRSLSAVAANFALGYGSLALINYLAPQLGFSVPINAVTLLAGGCLGLPGTALSAALQFVA